MTLNWVLTLRLAVKKMEPKQNMYYILVDDRDTQVQTFDSFVKAQAAYYRQWWRHDGSVPGKLIYGEYQVDPQSGGMMGEF